MHTAGPRPVALWSVYAQHAAAVMAGGPAPSTYVTDRALFVASGAHHVDMNQAVLFGGATDADAHDLVARILPAGVPVLLGCSAGIVERVGTVLERAGFVRLPAREALFWMRGAPPAPTSGATTFDVRQVKSDTDVSAMQALFEEAHGYEPELTGAAYGGPLRSGGPATGWIAWDGAEAVSFAIVTCVAESLSLWDVITPARHRRRGAARTVVGAALAEVADRSRVAGSPIEQTLFWSSPAGRPLYEAMGFAVVDDVDAWVLGASEEDLAVVGA